jgi:rfaE bifunctional protein kinase chain/domain
VVKVERSEERPGGAANVARNCAALGAKVSLLSVVGADEAGRSLARLMDGEGIETSLHEDANLSTTIKLRVVGRQQQLLRIDFENAPAHEVLRAKLADFERQLPRCDLVILSDYGKGGLAHIGEMIRLARVAGKPVLVDPKGEDYARYAGATLLTPNRAELRQVIGGWTTEAVLEEKVTRLRNELGLEALLVTRSEEGMTLFRAGDTVIASMAVMLASGADMQVAMRIANRTAGIVVGKLGTAVVQLNELRAAL